jgi:sugar-phosphatase
MNPGEQVIRVSCSGLLFDMDGVLINSIPAVIRVWGRWAQERGLDSAEVIRRSHGRPSIMTVQELLPDSDHQAENRKIEKAEIAELSDIVPLPGALELLRSLPPDRWTIVTSCTRPLAMARLEAVGLPQPARFVTASDIKNGKPSPEPYLKGAEVLGFQVDECIVVEDVPAGIRSGKSAGARVIGLRTTFGEPELRAAGADWILDSCADVTLADSTAEDGEMSLTLRPDQAS